MAKLINQKFLEGIDSSKFKIAASGALLAIDSQGNEVEILKLNAQDQALVLGVRPANKVELDQAIADLTAEIAAREAADLALSGRVDSLESAMPNKASISYVNEQDALTLAASKLYADQKVADLVGGAPEILDTLKEISDALGGDANLAGTLTGQIGAVQSGLAAEISRATAAETQALVDAKAYSDSKVAEEAAARIAGDAANLARIEALEQYDQESVFVDAVNGVDAPGRGTMLRPFKSINYAYSQVPSLGNPTNTVYNANVGKFITEKLVIKLAPGVYNENVVLGFKRARVAIVGNGVTITGDVRMEAKMADFPASSLRGSTMAASFPAPWTGWTSGVQQCFEIAGEAGGGLESDPTSNTVQITGLTSLVFAESSMTGPQWDSAFGTFFCNVRSASLNRGVVAATQHSAATPSMTEVLFEIDSARIGSELPVRNYFGGVPHGYIANYATWSSASNGTTNKAPSGAVTVKMHNSTMASVLGPRLTIGEMDGCRVYDIDRTMGGTVDNGAIGGSTSSSYVGIVNTQFRAYSGTNALQLGASSGTSRLKIDSVSYTTLAFSRNSSGVLSARSLVLGGTVFDFLDDARSIFVNDPATNYSRSDASVNAALEGIDAALGLKANQSSISSIESNVSSLQSGLAQEILDRQSGDAGARAHADSAVAVEKARAEAAEAALQSAISSEASARESADSALDARIDILEAKPSLNLKNKYGVLGAGDLQYIDLDFQAVEGGIIALYITRTIVYPGIDYTVSVVNGKTRLTFIGELANPTGSYCVIEGDDFYCVYAV
jgi:hypothetical protein